jgi:hypothetical protein
MQFKFISCLVVLFLMACSSKKESSTSSQTASADTAALVLEQANGSPEPQSIKELENFIGKKPSQVQLFEKFDLNKRIEKVLGSELAEFKSDWNDETPIFKDGEILYFTGCKTGACAENKYFMMLDLVENNFNIINIRNGRPRSFEEGAVIGMSDKVAEDFEKIRNAAGL